MATNKYLEQEGNLKYKSVKHLLTLTAELWKKVNEIAEECGVPNAEFSEREKPLISIKTIYTAQDIVYKVNKRFGVNVKIKSQKRHISEAKFAACFLLTKYTRFSQIEIAAMTGNKNHTTVINALRRYRELIETDEEYKAIMDNLIGGIENELTEQAKVVKINS